MDTTKFTQRNYDMTQPMIAMTQATVTFRNRWGQMAGALAFENADIQATRDELEQGINSLAAMSQEMRDACEAFIAEIEAERSAVTDPAPAEPVAA